MITKANKKEFIFLPLMVKDDKTSALHLLRVEAREKFTKIDFGYQTKAYYDRGGWINISPDTYLKTNGGQKLKITKAENIPYAPAQHHFETTVDYLFFSLYFPPLPQGTDTIDMIEADDSASDWFNFKKIDLGFRQGFLPGKE